VAFFHWYHEREKAGGSGCKLPCYDPAAMFDEYDYDLLSSSVRARCPPPPP
jgi:hypothetical protein